MSMWQFFVDFLEGLITKFGLLRIVMTIGVGDSALLGIGVAFDQHALTIVAVVTVTALLLLTCVAQSIDRRRLYRQRAQTRQVLNSYGAQIVAAQGPDSFDILNWEESIVIAENGDAEIVRWFTLEVGSMPLRAFWHRCYMASDSGDYSYRSRVKMEVRDFSEKGVLGVRHLTSYGWEEHSLRIYIHLLQSLDPGTPVRIWLKITWPGYYKNFLEGKHGSVLEWTFRRRICHLSSTTTFTSKLGLTKDLPISLHPGTPTPEFSGGGPRQDLALKFTYENPPVDTRIGFVLDRSVAS